MIASREVYERILQDQETLKQLIYSRLEGYFIENKDFSPNYEGLNTIFPGLSSTEYIIFLIAAMPEFNQGFYQEVIGAVSQTKGLDLEEFLAFGGRKGQGI